MVLPAYRGAERRDIAQRQALVQRLIAEFDEMPGLRLSLAQASRLFGVSQAATARILTASDQVGHPLPERQQSLHAARPRVSRV